eukprot:365535-Chlamydomonas_euryale.AAC.64
MRHAWSARGAPAGCVRGNAYRVAPGTRLSWPTRHATPRTSHAGNDLHRACMAIGRRDAAAQNNIELCQHRREPWRPRRTEMNRTD